MEQDVVTEYTSKQEDISDNNDNQQLFNDIKYICNSTGLITESLQKGFDVAQLPNGDIIVTEIKTVNVQYSWDKIKQKMVRISQS